MPRFEGRKISSERETSLGLTAHARALHAALSAMIDFLPDVPSERRVRLRDHMSALERAYPGELSREIEIEQLLAEEDGDGVSDQDP